MVPLYELQHTFNTLRAIVYEIGPEDEAWAALVEAMRNLEQISYRCYDVTLSANTQGNRG